MKLLIAFYITTSAVFGYNSSNFKNYNISIILKEDFMTNSSFWIPLNHFSNDSTVSIDVNSLLKNVTFDPVYNYDNILDGKCHVTNTTTQCINVDIFEAVKIFPSTTEMLDISKSPVQILRTPILNNLTNLLELKLTNNSIQYITSKLFLGLNKLHTLNLSENYIRALTKQVFTGCPNLRIIDLSKNRIISLTFIPAAFATLKSLDTIYLSNNNLTRILYRNLEPMKLSPIQKLDFSYTNLSYVDKGSFTHLKNLRVLGLKSSLLNEDSLANITYDLPAIRRLDLRYLRRINRFPKQAFLFLENSTLDTLDMRVNSLFSISNDSFSFLPNLIELRIAWCEITNIDDGAFDGIISLERLDLSHNFLNRIPTALGSLKKLTVLEISEQKLQYVDKFEIPNYLLSNLSSLTYFIMKLYHIKVYIEKFSFYGLRNLRYLSLSNCNIIQIKEYAFETLSSLEHLDLSYAEIFTGIKNHTFYGLRKLRILQLQGNDLMIGFNILPFIQMPSLEILYMHSNKISRLRSGIFGGLQNLKIINMRKNEMAPWNISIFDKNTTIEKLYLNDNKIDRITTAMLEDFDKVDHLNLSNNPFDCRNCNMERFKKWLIRTNSTDFNEDYRCSYPYHLVGYSIVDSDLSFNHCYPMSSNMVMTMSIGFSIFGMLLIVIVILIGHFKWYVRYWCFQMRSNFKRYSTSSEVSAYQYDAFVSYNSADVAWVAQKLLPTLESQNSELRLCIHDRDFEVGRLITENILESIDKSKKVLLVLTNSFIKSQWCMFELHVTQHQLFHDTRDALVLVQIGSLDKSSLTKNLKYLMHTRTLLIWPDDEQKEKEFWDRLYKVLSS